MSLVRAEEQFIRRMFPAYGDELKCRTEIQRDNILKRYNRMPPDLQQRTRALLAEVIEVCSFKKNREPLSMLLRAMEAA